MQKIKALEMLAGVESRDDKQADAPTNLHIISGEVGAASENGKVPVRIDGLVFGPEDTQYVDVDTLGGLEEGDTAMMILTGQAGHGMTPMAIGAPGSVDRAGGTATKYLTEESDTGLLVHRSTDDLSAPNGVHIDEDVDILRNGESVANYGETTRIGKLDSTHMVLDEDSIDFRRDESQTSDPDAATFARLDSTGLMSGDFQSHTAQRGLHFGYSQMTGNNYSELSATQQRGQTSQFANVGVRNDSQGGVVYSRADRVEIGDGTTANTANVSMQHTVQLARCRIDIAFGSLTVPANNGASVVLNWQMGGFDDANYIVAITRMSNPNGFNNVAWCVTNRTTDTVTVTAWNNNSYAVTQLIGCIGADSRYGTVS